MALYQTLGPIHSFAETACHEVEANVLRAQWHRLRAASIRTSCVLSLWKTKEGYGPSRLRKQRHDLIRAAWQARRCYLNHMKEAP